MRIEGSVALVGGGASGLGAATSRALAEAGATVVIADIDAQRGDALARELGGRFMRTDVRDEAQVQAAVQAAEGLRIAVSCAGTGSGERIAGSKGPHRLASFEHVIGVNLIGTFNLMRLAATAMLDNEPDEEGERGVIVCTASVAAFDGQIGQVAYSASKGGIVGMTLPAARDLSRSGVRVATIAPGIFDTPLLGTLSDEIRARLGESVPFPSRLGRPDEFAALVAHIVANPMLNGEVIRLDGALRMAPR